MARNLGGSVGLALLGVFIDRRDAFHDAVIRDSVTANSLIGQDHMASTRPDSSPSPANRLRDLQALGQLAGG